MAFVRQCMALAALLGAAQAVTPMEKVLSLLGDLKKSTEAEGKAEAKSYDKFACFCKSTTTSKSKAITTGQDSIDTTTATIGKKTATRKEKITKKEKEQQKIEETTVKLQETTETYNKDKQTYEATNADLTQAVNSAKRALKALKAKKGAALVQTGMKSDVQNCLELAQALNMVPKGKHEAMTSFLQVDPSDPAYKFHSDQILKIIGDLQKDFTTERTKVQTEWGKTDTSYKAEKKDLEGKISTAGKAVKKLAGEISKLKSEIAKKKSELTSLEASLADDSAYLRDLTTRCQDKANSWDQRTQMRNGEVAALTKALKVLNDKAKANDAAVNKRALLLTKKPVAAPAKAVVKATVSKPAVDVKKSTEKKAVSFLQVRAMSKEAVVAKILRDESARLNSNMLSSVANQIMADPFVKIKKLIQGLIERLLEESKAEATKKGFCDTELGKSNEDRKNRYADIQKLDADLADLKAQQSALKLEIKELKAELVDLKKNLKDAEGLRKTEKADNTKTIKLASEGAVAVGEALVILQDFYKEAAKGKFIQMSASPVDEDTQGTSFDGAYTGDQSSSKAILGLLEVIKSDFERTDRKTTAAEADALAEFVQFERSSKADIGSKSTKQLLDEQDLGSTETAITDAMKDMKTATKLLDSALKNIEELRPTCIDTGMSYAERVQKREAEMKALGKALCMLDADKVEPECQ